MACPSIELIEQCVEGRLSAPLARSVIEHVEGCPRCRDLMDSVCANLELSGRMAGLGDGEHGRPAPFHVPHVPGYEHLAEVHWGGQGIVTRARELRSGRIVALKVLLLGALTSEQERRRFAREIEVISRLSHPNIVAIHDSGTERQLHWLALEYVSGMTLPAWMDDQPRDLDETISLFRGICRGVAHAHNHGVIHRDLKPRNIMVDDAGNARVLDFGLSRIASIVGESTLTVSGAYLGTPAYSSPEQLRGRSRHVDERSDVFSLGVILYELLTGTHPFDVRRSIVELVESIQQDDPAPPSKHRQDVGPDLDALVLRALSAAPEGRQADVHALLRDMSRAR